MVQEAGRTRQTQRIDAAADVASAMVPAAAPGPLGIAEFEVLRLQALAVARSQMMGNGLAPEVAEADAMAKILVARELGLPPLSAAMNLIHMIPTKGGGHKLCLSGQGMLALIHSKGHVDVKIVEGAYEDGSGFWCECTMSRRDNGFTYTSHWDTARVIAAKLANVHETHPATMIRWRAVAEAGRVAAPDDLCGMYAPEEFGYTQEEAARLEREPRVVGGADDTTPTGAEAEVLLKHLSDALVAAGVPRQRINDGLRSILRQELGAKTALPTIGALTAVGVRACLAWLRKIGDEKQMVHGWDVPPTPKDETDDATIEGEIEPDVTEDAPLEGPFTDGAPAEYRESEADPDAQQASGPGKVGRLEV